MPVPQFHQFFNPLLKALRELGGSGSISEIEEGVIQIVGLTEEDLSEIHGNTSQTEFSYRLAWTRTYLKKAGYVENSARGVWALTSHGLKSTQLDEAEVVKIVRAQDQETTVEREVELGREPSSDTAEIWQQKLLKRLQIISPDAFERLCQRILREAGFIQVEVTGRSGDGGIDGTGIMRMGGFLSFHIIFQCKRYSGSISSQQIRDFRGAMVGRADKGLFITTGTFTQNARKEATRDGAPPIDLVDGNELVEKMKELSLGLVVRTEEIVEVDDKWFQDFS